MEPARYHACERNTGAFARSFVLPDGIEAGEATWEFRDGTLEVRVPLRN